NETRDMIVMTVHRGPRHTVAACTHETRARGQRRRSARGRDRWQPRPWPRLWLWTCLQAHSGQATPDSHLKVLPKNRLKLEQSEMDLGLAVDSGHRQDEVGRLYHPLIAL